MVRTGKEPMGSEDHPGMTPDNPWLTAVIQARNQTELSLVTVLGLADATKRPEIVPVDLNGIHLPWAKQVAVASLHDKMIGPRRRLNGLYGSDLRETVKRYHPDQYKKLVTQVGAELSVPAISLPNHGIVIDSTLLADPNYPMKERSLLNNEEGLVFSLPEYRMAAQTLHETEHEAGRAPEWSPAKAKKLFDETPTERISAEVGRHAARNVLEFAAESVAQVGLLGFGAPRLALQAAQAIHPRTAQEWALAHKQARNLRASLDALSDATDPRTGLAVTPAQRQRARLERLARQSSTTPRLKGPYQGLRDARAPRAQLELVLEFSRAFRPGRND